MTTSEHLLCCLAEECAEIAEICSRISIRASKAIRFGISDLEPGEERTAAERLVVELADLLAVVEILEVRGIITRAMVGRKKAKLSMFMSYAATHGTLDEAALAKADGSDLQTS